MAECEIEEIKKRKKTKKVEEREETSLGREQGTEERIVTR